MAILSTEDLVKAGWPEESDFGELLTEADVLEARGIHDAQYLLKLLAKKFPHEDSRMKMREEPLPFGEAITAVTETEEKNLAAVRRFMGDLMRSPVVEAGAIMPDACPAGNAVANIPVGGAIAARNAILPGGHGSDICCSLYATFFTCEREAEEMMDAIVASTRFGPGSRVGEDRVPHPVLDEPVWQNRFLNGLQDHAQGQMADQGDGNHFAFVGRVQFPQEAIEQLEQAGYREHAARLRAQPETFALVTHHGSRGLGAHVYKRGLNAAIKQTAKLAADIPDAAAWLSMDSEEGRVYWDALQYVGRWTLANHQSIHSRFLERTEGESITAFGNEHNFVWKRGDLFLHGKGATPAWNDELGRPLLGLIPLNMASPILMVLGSDNTDFLSFAPHGAGRNVSRRKLMRQFEIKGGGFDLKGMQQKLKHSIEGIDARWYLGEADFSECPLGYKSATQVRSQIDDFGLANVVAEIHPIGSVMAGRVSGKEEVLTPKQVRQIEHRSDRRKERQRLRSEESWDEQD